MSSCVNVLQVCALNRCTWLYVSAITHREELNLDSVNGLQSKTNAISLSNENIPFYYYHYHHYISRRQTQVDENLTHRVTTLSQGEKMLSHTRCASLALFSPFLCPFYEMDSEFIQRSEEKCVKLCCVGCKTGRLNKRRSVSTLFDTSINSQDFYSRLL